MGGHSIPEPIITRRYYSGLANLFKLHLPICDYWMIFDNSAAPSSLIAEGYLNGEIAIKDTVTFEKLKNHDKTG